MLSLLHQIPRSYLTLQETVIAEKQRREAKGEVQYLTDAQLDLIIEQNPGSDIRDYEDLQTGTVHYLEPFPCTKVSYSYYKYSHLNI